MRNHLIRYDLILTVRGPVYIGSGQEIKKTEWIRLGNGEIIITDPRRLMMELRKIGKLDSYVSAMTQRQEPLYLWAADEMIPDNLFLRSAAYSLNSDLDDRELEDPKRNIQVCIKDAYGNPYVPGSSVKGAIRNILLAAGIRKKKRNTGDLKEDIRIRPKSTKSYLSESSKDVQTEIFHTRVREGTNPADAVNDELRGIRISDSEPLNVQNLILSPKVDVHKDGEDKDIPLLREALKPGTEVRFTMTLDRTETEITAEEIQNAMDAFKEDYRKLFLAKFNYTEASDELKLPKGHILFLGGGTGYPTKTVMNQMLRDDPERVEYVAKAIQNALTGGKQIDQRKPSDAIKDHSKGRSLGVSRHIVKMTKYNGELLQMGLCEVQLRERP